MRTLITTILAIIFVSTANAQEVAKVESLSLVRSDNGLSLTTLDSGATIDLALLPSQMMLQASATATRKIDFYLNGKKATTDTTVPYQTKWKYAPGAYNITVVPYNYVAKRYVKGSPFSVQLTVVKTSTPTPTPIPTPTSTPKPTATPTPAPTPTSSPTPTITPSDQLSVFPSAAGFGTKTVAGSGRHLTPPSTKVYRVTTTAASGSGSLAECATAAEPRVCVFEVSGQIALPADIKITNPYITIAGQTAPAPGILISNAGLNVQTHDVLIQHLQLRPGDSATGQAAMTRHGLVVAAAKNPVYNVVLDHLSISWGLDENVATAYPNVNDVTISNSIISEGLHNSIHPDGPHSMGMLIGDNNQRLSVHHNLFAHNNDRNPRMKPGAQVEFISNVVYNWGGTSGWNVANLADTEKTGNPVLFNFIGNYYKRGPASPNVSSIYASPIASGSRIYVLSNIGPTRPTDSGSEWLITALAETPYRTTTPAFALSDVLPHSGSDTTGYVLQHAGARTRESNSVDSRIKSEVVSGTGSIRDCVSGCSRAAGGYPEMSINSRHLVLPEDPNGIAADGYTNLEHWLQEFSAEVEQ